MKKKTGLILTMTVLLAGCGESKFQATVQSTERTMISAEDTALLVWMDMEESEVSDRIDAFVEQSETEITIAYRYESADTVYETVLLDMENAADVFEFEEEDLEVLVQAGALASLDDAVSSGVSYDGVIYGVLLEDGNVLGVNANKKETALAKQFLVYMITEV